MRFELGIFLVALAFCASFGWLILFVMAGSSEEPHSSTELVGDPDDWEVVSQEGLWLPEYAETQVLYNQDPISVPSFFATLSPDDDEPCFSIHRGTICPDSPVQGTERVVEAAERCGDNEEETTQ